MANCSSIERVRSLAEDREDASFCIRHARPTGPGDARRSPPSSVELHLQNRVWHARKGSGLTFAIERLIMPCRVWYEKVG